MTRQTQIDGLRAVAILSVLFYHSGIKFFSGGFIGVDVFFVISGYLITNVLSTAPLNSFANTLNFFESRIRRIVPALYVMLLISTLASFFLLIPTDLLKFSNSLASAASFTSNIHFWAARDGYFDVDSFLSPLIHTWSLGIEMQFYLAIFLIFLVSLRFHFYKAFAISLFCLLSLTLSIYFSDSKPGASFFLTPFRIWELLYGSLLSLIYNKWGTNYQKICSSYKNILSMTGLLGILISASIFDENYRWPSYFALLPVISTGLVMLFAVPETYIYRLLSSPIFIILGAISYSIYLYHQPIFAFYKQYSLSTPDEYSLLICILMIFTISYLSYRIIELPFKSREFISLKRIFISALIIGALLLLFQTLSSITGGFKSRYSLPDPMLQSLERSNLNLNCYYQDTHLNTPLKVCDLGLPVASPSFMIIGDSHALSLYPAINQAAISSKTYGIFASKLGCPPLLDISLLNNTINQCRKFNDLIFDHAKNLGIKDIFLISKWNLYINGGYDGFHSSPIVNENKETNFNIFDSEEALKIALINTIHRYQNAGIKVHLVKQVPQQLTSPQKIYFKYYDDKDSSVLQAKLNEFSVHFKKHQILNQQFDNLINEIDVEIRKLNVISLDHVFCYPEICPIGNEDASYYYDDNHLSLNGALLTIPAFKKILNSL